MEVGVCECGGRGVEVGVCKCGEESHILDTHGKCRQE